MVTDMTVGSRGSTALSSLSARLSLRVEHFDGAEGRFERLREPDGDLGRGLIEHGVWSRLRVGKIGVGGSRVRWEQYDHRDDKDEGGYPPNE